MRDKKKQRGAMKGEKKQEVAVKGDDGASRTLPEPVKQRIAELETVVKEKLIEEAKKMIEVETQKAIIEAQNEVLCCMPLPSSIRCEESEVVAALESLCDVGINFVYPMGTDEPTMSREELLMLMSRFHEGLPYLVPVQYFGVAYITTKKHKHGVALETPPIVLREKFLPPTYKTIECPTQRMIALVLWAHVTIPTYRVLEILYPEQTVEIVIMGTEYEVRIDYALTHKKPGRRVYVKDMRHVPPLMTALLWSTLIETVGTDTVFRTTFVMSKTEQALVPLQTSEFRNILKTTVSSFLARVLASHFYLIALPETVVAEYVARLPQPKAESQVAASRVNTAVPRSVFRHHDIAWVMDSFMNDAECDDLRRLALKTGMVAVDSDYRRLSQAKFDFPEVAHRIWARLERHVVKLHIQEGITPPAGVLNTRDTQGLWTPSSVSVRVRVNHMVPDDFFHRHYDGSLVSPYTEHCRSFMSVLIYLNTPTQGGATQFYSKSGKSMADIQAKKGRILFYYHDISHGSAPIEVGEKWVLRADVLYDREPSSAPKLTDNEITARRLAKRLNNKSTTKERRAVLLERIHKLDPLLSVR